MLLHSTTPAGSDPSIKVRIYAVDVTTGRPTQAIGPEVSTQLPFTANSIVKLNFPTPIRIFKAQSIVIASMYNSTGITAGTINCSTFCNVGGTDGYTESYDMELTTPSITYTAGLPNDMLSLASPIWNGTAASSPANGNWTIKCNQLDA
jgi:hypothetical protein